MRIQHNIMAMNAYRNYNSNVSAMKSNLEKLSSGYKINRAGDDAAGLAISEKMRAQITGLNAAQKNVKDGISLVQTAEGAMQEVQDMLNRMVYLATQSANGTYDDEVDRNNLQKELEQLTSEIDRISDSANFNGIKLLDGSKAEAITESTKTTTVSLGTMTAIGTAKLLGTATNGVIGTNTISFKDGKEAKATKFSLDVSQIKWDAPKNETLTISVGANYTLTLTAGGDTNVVAQDVSAMIGSAIGTGKTAELTTGKGVFNITFADNKLTFELADPDAATVEDNDLDPSKSFTVATAGTNGSVKNQWNYGATDMVRGNKTLAGTPANTGVDLSDVIKTDGKTCDGVTIEVDGKSFVIASGKKSNFATVEGATSVAVNDDDTAEMVMEKLANAINAAGTIWSAGVATDNKLTLAQTNTSNDEKNAKLTSLGDIAATIKTGKATATVTEVEPTDIQKNASPLTLQIGDTADPYNKLSVKIGDIHAKALGIDKESINIRKQDAAAAAIEKIKNAINTVSSIRGDLGATQNRLEHTANNLSVMQENIQDAESSIRDTDVAEEMMSYTKNNILIQSAQAMLAQANQIPQGVLQLLQ